MYFLILVAGSEMSSLNLRFKRQSRDVLVSRYAPNYHSCVGSSLSDTQTSSHCSIRPHIATRRLCISIAFCLSTTSTYSC
ncbi:hypothetical protein GQ600_4356 [Phytophthora cactorum]|nr:hypothetical protein GQ600_4356 [Phytophthora cactorum]